MKKYLLLVMAVCSFVAGHAQTQRPELKSIDPVEASPLNLNPANPQEVLSGFAQRNGSKQGTVPVKSSSFGKAVSPKQAPRKAESDTLWLFAASQNHLKNYVFNVNGGDIHTYQIGIVRDGDKVTFHNFFDLAAQSSSWSPDYDIDFSGTYDDATKTISVPVNTSYENGTKVASLSGDYYDGILLAGKSDEKGTLTPDEQLVIKVEGDFERLTIDQTVALANFSKSGTTYGNKSVFRGFVFVQPKSGSELFSFNESLDLGEGFKNDVLTGSIDVVNLGKDATTWVSEVESDPEGYITGEPATGTVEGLSTATLTFALSGPEIADEVEGNATITYENGDAEGTLIVNLTGAVIPYPDFSPAVKEGSEPMSFRTNIECPFEMYTDEETGEQWAFSGTKGRGGVKSDLYVDFEVPEGKKAVFSWTGKLLNDPSSRYAWYQAGGYFVDSDIAAFSTPTEGDLSGVLEMAPGSHFVRFQHQANYYTGLEKNGVYVKDINIEYVDLPADAAELLTPSVNLGNFIVEEGFSVEGTNNIVIKNTGANPLKLVSVSSDNSEFTPDGNADPATTLNNLQVAVNFVSKTSGDKTANITVETTAGTFTVPVEAHVIDQPDFSKVVTEGAEYMTFTTNPSHPFIVDGNTAYNNDWNQPDTEASQYGNYTEFTVKFTIPEGKIGYFSWDGHIWGNPIDNENWTHYNGDHGIVEFSHQPAEGYGYGNSGTTNAFAVTAEEGGDGGSDVVFGEDTGWAGYLVNVPGEHTWTFRYMHDGNGVTYGKNRYEVSNIRLRVEDFLEHNAEVLTEGTITFDSTYVGYNRYTTATVRLRNTGSQILNVLDIKGESENSPFYGVLPTGYYNDTQFNNTVDLTLWFYPGVEPESNQLYTDNVIISTNAGDFTVPVQGVAKSSKGILLVGDFEDNAEGWTIYDADGDGNTWNLGTALWYDTPEYCHSGHQALGSVSGSSWDGDLRPDNWTFSHAVNVPEDGGVLTWYVAAHHHERYAEHYSVYVDEDYSDATTLDSKTPVFSETLPAEAADVWQFRIVDLHEYAGKTVFVAFRHHDCTGQYVLKLDDVFAYTNKQWATLPGPVGIDAVQGGNDDILTREYFNAAGQRVDTPQTGLNVVRYTLKDGSTRSKKFVIK